MKDENDIYIDPFYSKDNNFDLFKVPDITIKKMTDKQRFILNDKIEKLEKDRQYEIYRQNEIQKHNEKKEKIKSLFSYKLKK